jgi:hypothetical protein
MICLSYCLLCFLFNKIREEGRIGSAWKLGTGGNGKEEGTQTMYTHVSKCKNDKTEREEKKKKKKRNPASNYSRVRETVCSLMPEHHYGV